MYLAIIVVAIAVLLVCCGMSSHDSVPMNRDINQPVTDEEFMAACSVKDPEIALKVRQILSHCSGVDEENIHPHDRLIYELGME